MVSDLSFYDLQICRYFSLTIFPFCIICLHFVKNIFWINFRFLRYEVRKRPNINVSEISSQL